MFIVKKITGHTRTHTDREQHHPDTHTNERTTRTKNKNNKPTKPKPPNANEHLPQTIITLEGGATTVRATSHAQVGERAEVSVRGSVEIQLVHAVLGVKQSTGHTHKGHTDRENTPDTGKPHTDE